MALSKRQNLGLLSCGVAFAVIALDQLLKIWVKTHFYLGQHIDVLPFFQLRFVENPGMAFGMEIGPKIFLTLFRLAVVAVLVWYIARLIRHSEKLSTGYLMTLVCIAAGASGNIIDCLFYGEIFTNPAPPQVAEMVAWGGGYGSLFNGMVVDMIYLPLFSFEWPQWMPVVGGDTFSFFDPVFNLADAAISVGIVVLLIFYHKYLPLSEKDETKQG